MEEAWLGLLQPVRLTESGRPLLLTGEVERSLLDSVDLSVDPPTVVVTDLKAGVLTLTTYRILWIDQNGRTGGAIPLSSIIQVSPPKKNTIKSMFGSPRLRLQARVSMGEHGGGSESTVTFCCVLRGQSGIDTFVARLNEVRQDKAWESMPPEASSQPVSGLASNLLSIAGESSSSATLSNNPVPIRVRPAMVGVAGILRREQEQWEEADKNLQDAFQDLNALMAKAKEMVEFAEKIRAKLSSSSTVKGQLDGGDEDDGSSKQEMQELLLSVGITSPVTKETAGALYHQQLSRQLADFVRIPLQRSGGLLSLVDAYCLFNRARGTELISPEDLLQACRIFEKINAPVMLRRFESGVMVIEDKSGSDEEVIQRIRNLLMRGEYSKVGISASDAARALGVAPALAKEQLLNAESKGFLCRDDTPDGLYFFHNFFNDVHIPTAF